MIHRYRAFGLEILSEVELPQAEPSSVAPDRDSRADPDRVADVRIRYLAPHAPPPGALTPTTIRRLGIEALAGTERDGRLLLRWPGLAWFRATGGADLEVALEAVPGSLDPAILALYTLAEAFGMLLTQRDRFLLHASAVVVDGAAVVLFGRPGEGKSTLAAALAQGGRPLLADDMTAIDASGPVPLVLPAPPQLKLWEDALDHLGVDDGVRGTPVLPGSRKRRAVVRDAFAREPFPLRALVRLAEGDAVTLELLAPTPAVLELQRFYPCPSVALTGSRLARHLEQAAALTRVIPVHALRRPRDLSRIGESVAAILDLARSRRSG